MYKLIACDLDETLLNKEAKVCRRNIEAIAAARALGAKFVLATGRGYASVQETLEELQLRDRKDEYVISFNGAVLSENKENHVMYFNGLPFEIAEEIYRRRTKYDVCVHIYTEKQVYISGINEREYDFLHGRMAYVDTQEENLDFLKGQPITKLLFQNMDAEYLLKIEKDMQDLTHDVDISFSSNRYIEFNHKGVNKGAGLLRLAELLGIPQEETMAIGDNYNDLSMIRAAGLGAGVGNVVPGVAKECGYVAKAKHDEGGVAEILEKFVLNV